MEWIYLEIEENTVKPIVDDLWSEDLESEGFKIEKDPHVTLIPGYSYNGIPEIPDFDQSQPIDVSEIRCWPNIEKPMVVMLDVSDDMLINLWRDEILEQIGRTTVEYEIAPPHVTIFKAGNTGDETSFNMNSDVRNRLVDRIHEAKSPSNVVATDIVRTSWET